MKAKKSFFNWYMSLRFCAPRGLEALIVEAKKKAMQDCSFRTWGDLVL